MNHTISLTEESEQKLRQIARQGGTSPDQALSTIAEALLGSNTDGIAIRLENGVVRIEQVDNLIDPVRSSPGLMGGDACIRNTRIPVWLIVRLKQLGFSDDKIIANYPILTASDLIATWDFYATNSERVESERRSHEDAA